MLTKCLVFGAVLLCTVIAATADSPPEPYRLEIERVQSALQGIRYTVDVTVTEGSSPIHGFDMLFKYNPNAFAFQHAAAGPLFEECDWEYFTYRYGENSPVDGLPIAGVVRVVGLAETNNGSVHPTCLTTELPFVLFSLEFLISDDQTYECTFEPVRFFWLDCGDNALAVSTVEDVVEIEPALSRDVYDFDGSDITENGADFPTWGGSPEECMTGVASTPIRAVDFYNGGIDIACTDTFDVLIGDINLNRIPYEIADMVLFRNFFVYGMGVFAKPRPSAFASDINRDGIELTVEDFVSGIRIVVGDYVNPPAAPDTVTLYDIGTILSFEGENLGAVFLTFSGETSPTLLAGHMEMGHAYDSVLDQTRVLIYSFDYNVSLEPDQFLTYTGGNLIKVTAAAYDGNQVFIKLGEPTGVDDPDLLPSRFALYQNYPNPFNPKTVIPFDLPGNATVEFEVFNVLGELVYNSTGVFTIGSHEIDWRGIDNNNQPLAGGIYFYRLTVGESAETRKMILLK